jgi:hypothetical protein
MMKSGGLQPHLLQSQGQQLTLVRKVIVMVQANAIMVKVSVEVLIRIVLPVHPVDFLLLAISTSMCSIISIKIWVILVSIGGLPG